MHFTDWPVVLVAYCKQKEVETGRKGFKLKKGMLVNQTVLSVKVF